jgi:2-polyprenyl-3-methyl-5-hydroxy-6-metoxy-1,4-benzoquinol methylase
MIKNGRQAATEITGIREDHRARYQLAIDIAKAEGLMTAVDFGTGTGYGAWMMAQAGLIVSAFEIDQDAIDYGEKHYRHPMLFRQRADIAELDPPEADIITGFEIVEHTEHSHDFLARCNAKVIVLSVPNEDVIPFTQSLHRQHVRHYTPEQFKQVIEAAGWNVERMGCQTGKTGDGATVRFDTTNGRTLIAVARKCV